MKRSELNSICAEIQKRQLIELKADFLEMSKLSHDESSHFEDFLQLLWQILFLFFLNYLFNALLTH